MRGRMPPVLLLIALLLLPGCGSKAKPDFRDKQGFHFTPPPGWVERDREGALPAGVAAKHSKVPLPPLDTSGKSREHLVVRCDRATAGRHAWLRVSVAELPSSTPLKDYVATRSPGAGWKRAGDLESLEVGGLPAARVTFAQRWLDQDYVNESVAVRNEGNVYLISASFPAADGEARESVRTAMASVTWN